VKRGRASGLWSDVRAPFTRIHEVHEDGQKHADAVDQGARAAEHDIFGVTPQADVADEDCYVLAAQLQEKVR
jgi:hypothetical protein